MEFLESIGLPQFVVLGAQVIAAAIVLHYAWRTLHEYRGKVDANEKNISANSANIRSTTEALCRHEKLFAHPPCAEAVYKLQTRVDTLELSDRQQDVRIRDLERGR